MPPKSIFSNEEDLFIKNNVGVMSHSEIADILNNKYGYEKFTGKQVKGRANNKKWYRENYYYSYNKRFFQNIDTKEKAYWLGFIYADGYTIGNNSSYETSIQLQYSDINHLKKFANALEGEIPITLFMSNPSVIKKTGRTVGSFKICQIRLYGKDMFEDLNRLNLVQNKTYAKISPDLCYSDELNIAIIRGYFDGDGCIDKNGECHFTAYSKVFIDKVNQFLNHKNIRTSIYTENPEKQRLYIHRSNRIEFLKLLYSDTSYSYLNRKFNLAIKNINDNKNKFESTSPNTTVNSVNVVL